MSKLLRVAGRVSLGAVAAVVVVVLAACASASGSGTPEVTSTAAAVASDDNAYGVRLGEVTEGSVQGTVSADVWFPSYRNSGVWVRAVSVEGGDGADGGSPVARALCEVVVDVAGELTVDGRDSCKVTVKMKGSERQGVLLHLTDISAEGFYELDVRTLGDRGNGQPWERSVITLGRLLPSGAAR